MRTLRARNSSASSRRRTGIAIALLLCLAGCDGLLNVSNPGSLQEEQLKDPALQQLLINGVIGEFQFAYGTYALWSGVLADEVYTDHNDVFIRAFSRHEFNDLNVTNEDVYASLQRARQSADDAADRLKAMLGPSASSSLDVARALIYGGYAYVLLGEGFCEAPVNRSAALPSSELLARAIARFDEGITVATAARSGASVAAAQDLIYLASVGAARASLEGGNLAKARSYATIVPDTYERLAYYSANAVRENNAVQLGVKTNGPFLGLQSAFQHLDDPRVPQQATPRQAIGGTGIFPPLRPSMYSGWSATIPADIDISTHIRFASGLEARYVGVEADGPNTAMLSFVNARRAVGKKAPLAIGGSALLAELRAQRALDFFLTGQRLGDLRRYAAAGTDLFPAGKYPVPPEAYGAMHCFIVPRSEKTGNANF
ncbi:MAG: hypothetical protein JWL61_5414 [Gemmatimonadetes bacterium]|nr:hypothetical protein [Gemmatimonadota bacterium]